MRLLSTVLQDIKAQWIRYLLAGVTMLVGVVGVAGVSTIQSIAQDMLVAQQEQLNGRASSYVNSIQYSSADSATATRLLHALESRIGPRSVSVVLSSTSSMQLQSTSSKRDNVLGVSISTEWTLGDLDRVQRLPTVAGTMPISSVLPPSIALNTAAQNQFGNAGRGGLILSDGAGDHSVDFSKGGIVSDGLEEPHAYGSLAALDAFFPNREPAPLFIKISGPTLTQSDADQLLKRTTHDLGLSLADETRRVDTVQSVRDQVSFLSLVFGGCAAIVLLISAIGIANVGIASVTERAREFVVRRALGANRRDIFVQVLLASVIVGALVSLLAVGIEVVGVYAIVPELIPSTLSLSAPTFPFESCLVGIVAAIVTSILGGLLPAIKATRLEVALALRE